MTRSEIELIDGGNYGLVRKDRISSNQIKTRPASFNAISKVWNDFRLKFYTDRLNAEKESALTQEFDVDDKSRLTNQAVEQINNKSLVIARLEEKIKILSKESVPANYVDNRAIKLRTKMMNNLVNNCGNAYSIGVDKMDEVFGSAVAADVTVNNTPEAINNEVENDISVDSVIPIDLNTGNDESSSDIEVTVSEEQPVENVVVNNNEVVEQSDETPEIQSVDAEVVEQPVESPELQVINEEIDEQVVESPELQVINAEVEENSTDVPEIQQNDDVSIVNENNSVIDVVPIDNVPVDRSNIKDAIDFAFNNQTTNENPAVQESTSVNVDNQSDDSAVVDYDVEDDALVFDNDEPALFELINPNETENENVIVTDVKTDYANNVSDTPVISDSVDEEVSVSKNGTTKAKIDKYKEVENRKAQLKPFKVVTFKDIFRPSEQKSNDDSFNLSGAIGNSIDDVRYVPIIVPERIEYREKTKAIDSSIESDVTVSNVENMKNQYLQLQKLLRSKTARLNSVRAEREAVKTEVETSSKDKATAAASLNEKYQLMAKYIDDLQRQCAVVDDETASNENDINNDRRTIEDNRQAVISTQRAIKDLDDILRDSTSTYDDEDVHMRRVA